jgi:Short C-terminal domain
MIRASSAVSAADEIKKLAELHAAGILTDDEFAAKKKQLLGL